MTNLKVILTVGLMLATAGSAEAAFTTTGSSGEMSTKQIFEHLYGGTAIHTDIDWCGMSYTIGGVTATRVNDYVRDGDAGGNLYLLSPSLPGSNVIDQIWNDGVAAITARARFSGYYQQFGYKKDDCYRELI